MNQKTYRVWKELIDNPNEWMYVCDMATPTRLTAKQVTSILSSFRLENLQREHTEYGTKVMLEISDNELSLLKRNVIKEYHDIDDEFIDQVYSVLAPCGWITVTDIAYDTGLKPTKISAALTVMDNVKHRVIGSTQVYARGM